MSRTILTRAQIDAIKGIAEQMDDLHLSDTAESQRRMAAQTQAIASLWQRLDKQRKRKWWRSET